ncbi:tetratricopeptide repeat protein [Streptomyces sp. NPDC016309]|uniref:tetratricopeptide repeat protein n=1 Tax=Streptomyces sp. NPDC016309 TaxID=3364965 RepID=UPI0036F7D14B
MVGGGPGAGGVRAYGVGGRSVQLLPGGVGGEGRLFAHRGLRRARNGRVLPRYRRTLGARDHSGGTRGRGPRGPGGSRHAAVGVDRGKPAVTLAWDQVHPRLTHRATWLDHEGELPLITTPNTLTARVNLAVSYRQAGRTDKAITILERVVADRERLLGDNHPNTLTAPSNLEYARRSVGKDAAG